MFSQQSQEQSCGIRQPLSPVPDSTSLDMSSATSGGASSSSTTRSLARVPLPTPPATDGTPPQHHQLRCWRGGRNSSSAEAAGVAANDTSAALAAVNSNYLPNNEFTTMHGGGSRPVSSPFPTHAWNIQQQQQAGGGPACGYTLGPPHHHQFAPHVMFPAHHTGISYPHDPAGWTSSSAAAIQQQGPMPYATNLHHPPPHHYQYHHLHRRSFPYTHGHPEEQRPPMSYSSFSTPVPSISHHPAAAAAAAAVVMNPSSKAHHHHHHHHQYLDQQQKQQHHAKCSPPSPPNGMDTNNKVVTATPRRYKCTVCVKRFTRPSSLATHMHSHTGEVIIIIICVWDNILPFQPKKKATM